MFLVYIITSGNRSYIGMTNDFFKRWKQHNKIIKGGAKYTSKYENWTPICIVDGFKTKSEAMQCEWRLKRGKNGPNGRIEYLSKYILEESKWTKNSDNIENQKLNFYIDQEYLDLFYKYKHSFKHKDLYWK